MNITPNKHKLYENLGFEFYLGRGAKNKITKLYNIFFKYIFF